jgi:hypothetical protein
MNEEKKDNIEINEKKLELYSTEKIKVHIEKYDGIFLNGYVIRKIGNGLWLFSEDKMGDIPLLAIEIESVNPYIDRDYPPNKWFDKGGGERGEK